MYKLWHKLFGWDYILVKWGFSDTMVARIKTTTNGREYFNIFSSWYFLDEQPEYKFTHLTRKVEDGNKERT